jgi:hypothetical protein
MFNLAIDSKLRGCDVTALKVEDVKTLGAAERRRMPLGAAGTTEDSYKAREGFESSTFRL